MTISIAEFSEIRKCRDAAREALRLADEDLVKIRKGLVAAERRSVNLLHELSDLQEEFRRAAEDLSSEQDL